MPYYGHTNYWEKTNPEGDDPPEIEDDAPLMDDECDGPQCRDEESSPFFEERLDEFRWGRR